MNREEFEGLICDKLGMWLSPSIESLAKELERLFKSSLSLPPAEGAEEIIKLIDELTSEIQDEYFHDDDVSGGYIESPGARWVHVLCIMYDKVAALQNKPQPTAEGAEEILAKGKVLMYGNIIVDPIMLPEGIYATKELRIYLPETTIEHLIETGKMFRDETQTQWLPDSYFDNLSKCELIDVDVVRDATLHAQRIADKIVMER